MTTRKSPYLILRGFRAKTAWIAIAAYALLGMGGAQGAVLCFGADGHIAVESALGRPAGGSPAGAGSRGEPTANHLGLPSTGHHRIPCADLVFIVTDAGQQLLPLQHGATSEPPPSPSVPIYPAVAAGNGADGPLAARASHLADATIALLRTVVILS